MTGWLDRRGFVQWMGWDGMDGCGRWINAAKDCLSSLSLRGTTFRFLFIGGVRKFRTV